jgi:hypothetical protein
MELWGGRKGKENDREPNNIEMYYICLGRGQ